MKVFFAVELLIITIADNNALFGFTKIKKLPANLTNKKQELEMCVQKQPKNSTEENHILDPSLFYIRF